MDTDPKNPSAIPQSQEFQLEPIDAKRLAILCGQFGDHLKLIEKSLDVAIHQRGNVFSLHGKPRKTQAARSVIEALYAETLEGNELTPNAVHLAIQESKMQTEDKRSTRPNSQAPENQIDSAIADASIIQTKKCTIKPRGENQQTYVRQVRTHDINFGTGPAGTGKTWLAVACAVDALLKEEIERILLVRPAVEAGEKLGFLPGDLSQKVDPYLRPLYDALFEMLGFESVGKLIERNIIEVAPLAYMRGRTLNSAFIILDEAQNTTPEQMKMFLTRIGFGSTAVITGDPSQVDLPRGQESGLKHCAAILDGVEGISFTRFQAKDVVRHNIVQRIVEAYDRAEAVIRQASSYKREQD